MEADLRYTQKKYRIVNSWVIITNEHKRPQRVYCVKKSKRTFS
jgi:hypothetical protein